MRTPELRPHLGQRRRELEDQPQRLPSISPTTHIFVDDAQIDRTEFVTGLGNVRLFADVDASVDIVSLGFKYKWGGRAEPLK